MGVFVSIGTGKRPAGSDQNSHLWYEGFMGEFAEARRRLISKIEGCEETHRYMVKEGLSKRGVNIENYYRFNVEIGVGEFGMNEWNRLADISTGTRRYLGKGDVQRMNNEAAVKLAKIIRAKARFDRNENEEKPSGILASYQDIPLPAVPEAYPGAIELPAEVPEPSIRTPPPRPSYESGHNDNLEVPGPQATLSPHSSKSNTSRHSPHNSNSSIIDPTADRADRLVFHAPTPSEYRTAGGADMIAITSPDEEPHPPPKKQPSRVEPPPLPPKTPIQDLGSNGLPVGRPRPPYPADDRPPPIANMARKPEYKGR